MLHNLYVNRYFQEAYHGRVENQPSKNPLCRRWLGCLYSAHDIV
jgi:hypothetical protein